MSEKVKVCELCEEQLATVLCAECYKCYCDECCEFAHRKGSKKDHKTEAIPKGVMVDARCPLHKENPLELFCVDDTELCCPKQYKECYIWHKNASYRHLFGADKSKVLRPELRSEIEDFSNIIIL